MRKIFIGLLLMIINISCVIGQTTVIVGSTNDYLDLSYAMELFAQSNTIEEFEYKLNDPRNNVYNGDLNSDGYIDYLRCIERRSSHKHYIVIQAVFNSNRYKEIAEIQIERSGQNIYTVIVGDRYLYGTRNIYVPVYTYYPNIYSWLWSSRWVCWHSPYHHHHYPHWYRPRHHHHPHNNHHHHNNHHQHKSPTVTRTTQPSRSTTVTRTQPTRSTTTVTRTQPTRSTTVTRTQPTRSTTVTRTTQPTRSTTVTRTRSTRSTTSRR